MHDDICVDDNSFSLMPEKQIAFERHHAAIAKSRNNLCELPKGPIGCKIAELLTKEMKDILDDISLFDEFFACVNFILAKDCWVKTNKEKKKRVEANCKLWLE